MIAPSLDRAAFVDWYRRNRDRSARIFGLIDEASFYDRPIPLRHPFIFYEGHIPAFSFNTLNARALHESSIDSNYQRLFERGIDPGSSAEARAHQRADWPTRQQVAEFAARCDERVVEAMLHARIDDPAEPRLVKGQSVFTILEHEPMHHETLLYIVHQLPYDRKRRVAQTHRDEMPRDGGMREIAAGTATLGARLSGLQFGWDNEFVEHRVDVPAFSIATYPVTNGEWLEFVAAGGPVPQFWVERDGQWMLHGQFDELPLPRSWPVYVTHAQAEAYARWRGMRLPTEPEYHRAAFGTPDGGERAHPWGDAPPSHEHGNFDFQRYDPEPVGSRPAGASAWGVHELVGNGWEWTSTPFAPFDGFEPMASYPQYSADFFDGKHYVMKGAAPVTARELVRRSLRNWFYDDYPYMYAKFRCVA